MYLYMYMYIYVCVSVVNTESKVNQKYSLESHPVHLYADLCYWCIQLCRVLMQTFTMSIFFERLVFTSRSFCICTVIQTS